MSVTSVFPDKGPRAVTPSANNARFEWRVVAARRSSAAPVS